MSTRTVVPCILIATLVLSGCTKNEITGRRKFNAIPDGVMNGLGKSGYSETLASANVIKGTEDAKTLRRVGEKISGVVDEKSFAWQYSLIDDPTINAWCMPGGYIGFYNGILPFLQSEAGMAFVMGHEVGHATARHSSERLTQTLGVSGALTVAQAFISGQSNVSAENKSLLFQAIGLGAEVGIVLPFSRAHETEADIIGLMYMAEAGYPPVVSKGVWERMGAGAGARPPEFLSTHPAPDTRIKTIDEWLPQARKKYNRSQKAPAAAAQPRWGG